MFLTGGGGEPGDPWTGVQGLTPLGLQGGASARSLWMLMLVSRLREGFILWSSATLPQAFGIRFLLQFIHSRLVSKAVQTLFRRDSCLRNAAFPYLQGFQHRRNRPEARCSSGWTLS